ncbi:SoxR reducing system RseC family protein [Magnetospira thiophila]
MTDVSYDSDLHIPLVEGTAWVLAVSEESVWLQAESQSACGSCQSTKSCGVSTLSKFLGRKDVRFRLNNDFDARPGERVVIGISQSALLGASIIAYMVPVLGLMIGAVGGSLAGFNELATVVTALSGLIGGFALSQALGRRPDSLERLNPVFLRRADGIVFSAEDCPSDSGSRS